MDNCGNRPDVRRRTYDCGGTRQVIKHEHIVKHRHDIINEYDVIHEHEYNYYDVVRERNVVRHNDQTNHEPDYCCERENGNGNGIGNGDFDGVVTVRGEIGGCDGIRARSGGRKRKCGCW